MDGRQQKAKICSNSTYKQQYSNAMLDITRVYRTIAIHIISNAHSFLRAAEFRAELRNLPSATEFTHFRKFHGN
jgi:hypothetical protein